MYHDSFHLDRALAIVAATRNYDSGNTMAAKRILQINDRLKQLKVIPGLFKELIDLVQEALTLKKLPQNEIEERLGEICNKQSKKIQLFCFPYAGGLASIYKEWNTILPNITICAVEYPGRGMLSQERKADSLESLLDFLEKNISDKIQGPFAFFGHSLGAIIAFELSKRLENKNKSPISLFLSACPAPHKISAISSINHLNDQDFLQKVQDLNGTPSQLLLEEEFFKFFLPILRNDFSLLDDYKPSYSNLYKIPIHLYGGKEDRHVPLEDIQAWSEVINGTTSVNFFEGDHFFIRQPMHMLEHIQKTLA